MSDSVNFTINVSVDINWLDALCKPFDVPSREQGHENRECDVALALHESKTNATREHVDGLQSAYKEASHLKSKIWSCIFAVDAIHNGHIAVARTTSELHETCQWLLHYRVCTSIPHFPIFNELRQLLGSTPVPKNIRSLSVCLLCNRL